MAAGMTLRARLDADETVFTAWSAIPDPLVPELLARSGYDAVTLDMQHGCHSTDSVMRGVGAVTAAGKPAVVRIPVGRFDMASRALDFGAAAVIAPMVNSLADARAFAAAMKYPPLGERSWGPTRALDLHGYSDKQAYLQAANRETLSFAMIETRAAVAALDDVLAVDGIDGIFIGPSDLSVALSEGARVDGTNEEVFELAAEIAGRARRAGKIACAFSTATEVALRFRDMGCRFIALGTDGVVIARGAASLLEPARASA